MSNILKIAASGVEAAAPTDYQIERSLRFNSADTAYLSRTPASAGNRKTWTWSGWVKRSIVNLGTSSRTLFSAGTASSPNDSTGAQFSPNGEILEIYNFTNAYTVRLRTTQAFQDVSAWYHIVIAWDTTQATSSNRIKLYVNGVQVTAFSTATYPTQNTDYQINNTVAHYIGRFSQLATAYSDEYLTEIHFVDGQALTADDFGETDATTGVWKPKAYTGTYGTNGFYLDFSDNTSATTLGYDAAGSNDWTLNNFSVAAGAGNDSLVDTPTPYGTDTGAGGEVRGNYCTWNRLAPIVSTRTLSNGNLSASLNGGGAGTGGTMKFNSGKWYWEATITDNAPNRMWLGWLDDSYAPDSNSFPIGSKSIMYASDGDDGVTNTPYGATYTTNDVIGCALDLDTGTATFYKNGVSQGTMGSSLGATNWRPMFTTSDSWSIEANFGQRPFAYTAPSGFKALCTQNLPEPTIADGSEYFNTVLYTGNGSTQSITGLGFQPDWTWLKSRNGTYWHRFYDAVRGVTKVLYSNSTDPEGTESGLTSFDSDGFSLGSAAGANNNTTTYAAWNWNAGGSNATNTDGTITSTVRANPTAGFSIVSYTGTGSAATVGHGLGVAPKVVLIKQRSDTNDWYYYTTVIDGSNDFLYLNQTDAKADSALSVPSSSVFSIGSASGQNASGSTYIAYCFAEIEGFSKFGSYTGNGSTDGPFVYCGFRPAFVILKAATVAATNWQLNDSARDTFNIANKRLAPSASDEELTNFSFGDFLSNGFKIRQTDQTWNTNGATYIFMAFAENPFKYSLAR